MRLPESNTRQIMPLRKALMWIFLSVFVISGSSYAAVLYYRDLRNKQLQDPFFNIVAVAQTTSDSMRLNTACLAELLDLSIDRPTNFFSFNVKDAECKLNQVPVIKRAHVKKIQPGLVHVDYALRKPVALLADYTNTAVDAEGFSFPINPFFTPKKLPGVYLGLVEQENGEGPGWGKPLTGRKPELALSLLEILGRDYTHPLCSISFLDVSKAFAPSCGERQIVLVLEELIEEEGNDGSQLKRQPRILRLGTDNYEEQLKNYLVLQKRLWLDAKEKRDDKESDSSQLRQATIIDLRLSDLAFIR